MVDARSTHIPEFSGGVELVTGSLIVDTRLREVQAIVASMAEDNSAGSAAVSISYEPAVGGATVMATIKVWAADNVTPSVAETKVGWMALGK